MDIAALAGSVVVKIGADLSPLEKGLESGKQKTYAFGRDAAAGIDRGGQAAKRFGNEVAGAAARAAVANDNVRGSALRVALAYEAVHGAATRAASAMGAIAGSLIVRALTQMADSWSDLRSRVGLAIKDMNGADAVLARIGQTARMTYSGLNLTAEGFVRNATVLNELGKSTKQQLDYQEALNNALVVSGAKGQAAEFVQESLNRSMALGAMRGIELNNVLNYGSRIAELLAGHFNTTTGGLMKLAQQGKITGAVLFDVLTKKMVTLREEAESMPATIADGFTLIRNSLLQTIGAFDQANQLSAGAAAGLVAVADNIGTAFGVAGVAALLLAAHLAGPVVSGFAAVTVSGLRSVAMLGVYDVATRKLNVSLTLATASARAFGAALSLVGGPAGAALIAVGAALYVTTRNAREARERSELYAAAIKKAGENSESASGGIREVARALEELKTGATDAERAVTSAMAQTNVAVADMTMAGNIQKLGATMGWASVEIQGELQTLRRSFFDGKITAEDFINKVDGISRLNPDASPVIAEIQRIAREAAAAMGVVDALSKSVEEMAAPKGDRLVPKLSDDDFNKRFGGRYTKTWKELFPDLYKDADKEAEKAAKAYKRLIDSAELRVGQLRVELDLIGQAGSAVEAYRMEQDMLTSAVQNGVNLDSKAADGIRTKREEIHDLTEETRAYLQALAETNLAQDLAFERAQLGRTEVDQRVASQLRDVFGDEYVEHMNGAIAGQIRYNEELRKTGEFAEDAFGIIIDALTSSGDLADNLIKAFSQIGKLFGQIGSQKIFDYISGKSSSLFGGLPAANDNVGGGSSVANLRVSGNAIGETIAPPITASLNSGLETYAAAIRKMESGSFGGNYGARGQVVASGMYAGDRAYGAYQVMGKNIESWTKQALGFSMSQKEFLADQTAQDKVFYTRFSSYLEKYGNSADAISAWFSGGPLSANKNKSDGYTTVPDYVNQVQRDAGALKRGVSAGVQDGIVKTAQKGLQQDQFDTSGPGSVSGMSRTQGMLGVGGAAIGAFAGGYESGSPLMGGISGAMSGLGAAGAIGSAFPALAGVAGPIGLIGGAVIGLIGGILGKAKKKREELKKAQEELESQIGAISNLMRTAVGNYLGSMEKEFSDTSDEFQKAIALAQKAKNTKLVNELKDAQSEFFDRLVKDWNAGFEGALQSMNAGLGLDGEFLKGMSAVDKMRESLVGFVNDAKFFAEANGDLSKMLDARKRELGIGAKKEVMYRPSDTYKDPNFSRADGIVLHQNEFVDGYKDIGLQLLERGVQAFNKEGGQLYTTLTELKDAAVRAGLAIDEQGKVTVAMTETIIADAVARAQEAARATALASLSGGKSFTEIEQAIQRLEGAAASLPDLLKTLGMSAEDAADAIEHHLNYALDNLRKNYINGLNASINDLSDFGFLNEIIAAQDKYRDRLIETGALGLDGSLALKEFNLSLAKTIKGADLTEKQIGMLAAAFPAIAGIIDTLAGKDVLRQVEDAKSALQAAYDKEKSAIEQTISRLESFTKAIKTFRDEMRLSSSSPLGQKDQVDEAAKQFRELAQKAMGGDHDAMDKLTGVSQSYLDEAREYYASSEDYFKIWNEVDKTLAEVESKAGRQLTEQQKQLAALDKQVAGLITINDSVLTVAQAVAGLNAAFGARDKALQDQINAAKGAGQTADPFITSLYKSVLNRAPDAEGAAYYNAFLKAGMSHEDLRKKFIENAQPELKRGYPQFALGGDHMGGLRIVGERGPELEATGASRIFNAQQTERMLRQSFAPQVSFTPASNDNGAQQSTKELQREIARLNATVEKMADKLGDSDKETRELLREGNEYASESAAKLRRLAMK